MDRDEAIKLLKSGPDGIRKWNQLREHDAVIPDLSGANLVDSNLVESDLSGAILIESNLSGANIRAAILIDAILIKADLSAVNLGNADLSGADLSQAKCWYTVFANVNLSNAKGLDTIWHIRGSSIGIDSLFRTQGKIPESFVSGCCGVDISKIIDRVTSLKPIQFYSCFISYSRRNLDFAERLYADLRSKGVPCWFDLENIKIGDKLRNRVAEAIRAHEKLMLVLTEYSIASEWVEAEVEAAMERERLEKRNVLFPIQLDDALLKSPIGWVSQIRQMRQIGDFRGWQRSDNYERALTRLLRDLTVEESVGAKQG